VLETSAFDGKKEKQIIVDDQFAKSEQRKFEVPRIKKELPILKSKSQPRCPLGLSSWQKKKLQKLSEQELKKKKMVWVPKKSIQIQDKVGSPSMHALWNPSQARSGSTTNQQNDELEVGFGVHAMAPKVASKLHTRGTTMLHTCASAECKDRSNTRLKRAECQGNLVAVAFKRRRQELTQHSSVKSRNKSLPGRGAPEHHWRSYHQTSSPIVPVRAPWSSYPGIFDYNQCFWYSPWMPFHEFQYPNWDLPERHIVYDQPWPYQNCY